MCELIDNWFTKDIGLNIFIGVPPWKDSVYMTLLKIINMLYLLKNFAEKIFIMKTAIILMFQKYRTIAQLFYLYYQIEKIV